MVDTQKTSRKGGKKKTIAGSSTKTPALSKNFAEDGAKSRTGTTARGGSKSKKGKSIAGGTTKSKRGKKVGVTDKGKKINHLFEDSGNRFVVNRKPYPPAPLGYIYRPWLATDTDNESLTHGEESSGNETGFSKEKADIIDCSEKGYTLDDLLGRYNKRPMNTHL